MKIFIAEPWVGRSAASVVTLSVCQSVLQKGKRLELFLPKSVKIINSRPDVGLHVDIAAHFHDSLVFQSVIAQCCILSVPIIVGLNTRRMHRGSTVSGQSPVGLNSR